MTKKLFVDDERKKPDNTWSQAFRYHEAIGHLDGKNIDFLSLDHDLSDANGEGIGICNWMIQNLYPVHWPTTIVLHSANQIGVENMRGKLHPYKPTRCKLYVVEYKNPEDFLNILILNKILR